MPVDLTQIIKDLTSKASAENQTTTDRIVEGILEAGRDNSGYILDKIVAALAQDNGFDTLEAIFGRGGSGVQKYRQRRASRDSVNDGGSGGGAEGGNDGGGTAAGAGAAAGELRQREQQRRQSWGYGGGAGAGGGQGADGGGGAEGGADG